MSDEDTIDIGPRPSTIGSIQAKQQPWWLMLAELIDNSLDAQATTVRIVFDKDSVIVEDDGVGCEQVADMLTLGAHSSKGRITAGMWGVGGTTAMIWIGRETRIDTVHQHVKRSVRVDWSDIKAKEKWTLPRPLAIESDAAQGTRIAILRLRTHKPKWDELISRLGAVFGYAIEDGRRITLKPPSGSVVSVEPPKAPMFSRAIQETIHLTGGRKLLLNAGIVARGQTNERPGLTYIYTHRVLKESCAVGLGDGNAMAVISGSVRLVPPDKWKKRIPTNKDGLGPHEEEIDQEVTRVMQPLLAEAQAQADELHTKYLEQDISDGMTEALLANVKESRSPKEKSDDPHTEKNERNRKRARRTQPGERALSELRRCGIRLQFAHIGIQNGRLGKADTTKHVVTLSLDHPWVKKLHDGKERLLLAREAFEVYLDELAHHDDEASAKQMSFFGVGEMDVRSRFWEMLSKVLVEIDFDRIAGRRLSVVPTQESA